jgi:hypothetical protein
MKEGIVEPSQVNVEILFSCFSFLKFPGSVLRIGSALRRGAGWSYNKTFTRERLARALTAGS